MGASQNGRIFWLVSIPYRQATGVPGLYAVGLILCVSIPYRQATGPGISPGA